MRDLVVLVADRSMERVFSTILEARFESLGIRPVSFDVFVNPRRDPGCLRESDSFLRPFARQYSYALVAFDHDGCGHSDSAPEDLSKIVSGRLKVSGWGDRAEVLVIVPELEVWVWSESPRVAEAFGWPAGETVRHWLHERGQWPSDSAKPSNPKTAVELLMRATKRRSPSAVFRDIAATVSLERCTDPCFIRLRTVLQTWFPREAEGWTGASRLQE